MQGPRLNFGLVTGSMTWGAVKGRCFMTQSALHIRAAHPYAFIPSHFISLTCACAEFVEPAAPT